MEEEWIVGKEDVVGFIERCFTYKGVRKEHALSMADMMVSADIKGHYSHGVSRLGNYLGDCEFVNLSEDAEPTIFKETVATALVDGNDLWGSVVGNFCMDLAMKKAKNAGMGWVTARGSNHFGSAGYYSTQAMRQGLIGIALTNANPKVVPTRAKESVYGTNPISVAAPANNNDSFVLDMATSAVSHGKIEVKAARNEPIPSNWGLDADGKQTRDASKVIESGRMMPLGGSEETSGYKGYGLGMMVEILCSVLGASDVGPDVKFWTSLQVGPANLGQTFVAIDPEVFAPGFNGRLQDLVSFCRNLQPADGETEVLVPGDPERKHAALCDDIGGIPYSDTLIHMLDDIAANVGVQPVERRRCNKHS